MTTTPVAQELPKTGASAAQIALIGGLILVLGAGALLLRRLLPR